MSNNNIFIVYPKNFIIQKPNNNIVIPVSKYYKIYLKIKNKITKIKNSF
jgi:hypothetical protein